MMMNNDNAVHFVVAAGLATLIAPYCCHTYCYRSATTSAAVAAAAAVAVATLTNIQYVSLGHGVCV